MKGRLKFHKEKWVVMCALPPMRLIQSYPLHPDDVKVQVVMDNIEREVDFKIWIPLNGAHEEFAKLIPSKQKTWDEIIATYAIFRKQHDPYGTSTFSQWLKKNYQPPIEIK